MTTAITFKNSQKVMNKRSKLVRTISSIKAGIVYWRWGNKQGKCTIKTLRQWVAGKDSK